MFSMVALVFEDPPEYQPATASTDAFDIRKNEFREDVIAELRSHPGRWAVVSRHASRNRASQVSYVLRARHPDGYEFRVARKPDGEGVVYGRYSDPDANI